MFSDYIKRCYGVVADTNIADDRSKSGTMISCFIVLLLFDLILFWAFYLILIINNYILKIT